MFDRGGSMGGRAPLFLAKSILFSTLYTMSEKIFLKLNLVFIVAEIRGVFGSVGVYACVCESKSWPLLFFVLQRPHFEWYPRSFWSQKYMPDCRKSHLILQNFPGRPPSPTAGARAFGARFRASPIYRAPFSKFLDPPLFEYCISCQI